MRRLVIVISAIVFLDAMLFGALIPLLPGYVDDFGLTKLQAGLLLGAFGAGAVIGGVPEGYSPARSARATPSPSDSCCSEPPHSRSRSPAPRPRSA